MYLRYFHLMNLEQRVTHERLTRICFIDYDREMALVAERRNPETGESEILAVGRMMKVHGTKEGEVAVLVSDKWQGRGLGRELLSRAAGGGGGREADQAGGRHSAGQPRRDADLREARASR